MGNLRTLLGMFAAIGACAGCADDLYVMSEHYEILEGGERKFDGGGCVLVVHGGPGVGGGSSGGFGTTMLDFRVSEEARDDMLIVIVNSRSTEIARRSYDEKFLASGKRDEFSVTTQAGRHYELAYWGGNECDTSHIPKR